MPNTKKRLKIAFVVVDDRFTTPSPIPRFGAAPTAVLQGFSQMHDDVEIHVISCTMGQPENPDKIASNIYFHGVNVPKSGYLRSLHFGCFRSVKPIINRIQPDIIHAQGTERWCAWITSFLPYTKVLTIHGNLPVYDREIRPTPRAYWKLQTLLHKLCVPRFDGVLCNSRHTMETIRKTTRKTWEVPNALRAEFFQPQASQQPYPIPVILNVGVFHPNKRQQEILEFVTKLHQDGLRFKLRMIGLIGNSEYCAKCRNLIAQGEALGYVDYRGVITADEMVTEMDRAHGMIHFPLQESFGLVVAEALARNLKLFASSVGGIADIASGVPGAELFEYNDWDSLRLGIKKWLDQGAPKQYDASDSITARFSPLSIARQHLAIYRELLNQ